MNQLPSAYQCLGLSARVMGESAHGLITLLLEKLCDCLCQSINTLVELKQTKAGNERIVLIKKMAKTQAHALKIIEHMELCLNDDHNKELAQHLRGLYLHIQGQILLSAEKLAPESAMQALHVSNNLLNIWQTIPDEFHHISTVNRRE